MDSCNGTNPTGQRLQEDDLRSLIGRPLVPFFTSDSEVNSQLQVDQRTDSRDAYDDVEVSVRKFNSDGYFEDPQTVRRGQGAPVRATEASPEQHHRTRSRASPSTTPSAGKSVSLDTLFGLGGSDSRGTGPSQSVGGPQSSSKAAKKGKKKKKGGGTGGELSSGSTQDRAQDGKRGKGKGKGKTKGKGKAKRGDPHSTPPKTARTRSAQDRQFTGSKAFAESEWFASSPDPSELPPPQFTGPHVRSVSRMLSSAAAAAGGRGRGVPAGDEVHGRRATAGTVGQKTNATTAAADGRAGDGSGPAAGQVQHHQVGSTEEDEEQEDFDDDRDGGGKHGEIAHSGMARQSTGGSADSGVVVIHGLQEAQPLQL